MEDKDILYQLLNLEKGLSDKYNKITMECIDNKLRSEMNSILENQNNLVFDLKDEIMKRKSQKQTMSSNEAINSIKQKYSEILSQI